MDLTDLSYIDSSGEQLLKWLATVGAEFVAGNVYAKYVCEQLRLPILEHIHARPKQRFGDTREKVSITHSHAG